MRRSLAEAVAARELRRSTAPGLAAIATSPAAAASAADGHASGDPRLMATVAITRRPTAVARATTDRAVLRAFLEPRTACTRRTPSATSRSASSAGRAGAPRTTATRWWRSGSSTPARRPQPLFVMGRSDGIGAVLRDVIRPRAAYIAARTEMLPAVEAHYRVDAGPQMVRMWVDRAHFRPYPATVQRLLPVEIGELNRLYQLGFASWLPSTAIADGVYYGMRVNGRLVAAAGTHVVSQAARLAVVGNVLTHTTTVAAVSPRPSPAPSRLSCCGRCDQVVLNVRADNPPAINAYRHLGYSEHARFEERLIHRLGPPWAGPCGATAPTLRPQGDRPPMTTEAILPAHDVADLGLAAEGVRRIEWAEREMPVLRLIRERFERDRPLDGHAGRCLPPRHDRDGEPDADSESRRRTRSCSRRRTRCRRRTTSRPHSSPNTGSPTSPGAARIATPITTTSTSVADTHPQITMDDGCDLVSLLHSDRPDQVKEVLAGTEETTTGVIRLKAMAADGALGFPVVAVNEAQTKHLFDNRYGTGQSHARRHRPRHEHADRRPQGRRRGLWLGGQGHRIADGRPRSPCRGRRGRSGTRARGTHGRVRGHDPRRRRALGRAVRDGDRQPQRLPARALRGDARRCRHGQLRSLRCGAGSCRAARARRGPRPRGP